MIEVYYAKIAAKKWAAFLRWVPRSGFDGDLPEPSSGDLSHALDIAALTEDQLVAAFADDDATALFQLAGTGSTSKRKRHLLFRGAFLFDQFAPGEGAESDKRDVRWALARSFMQGGKKYFSEVVFGQQKDDGNSGCRIRLNLALPTPGPQSGDSAKPCHALPFAAIFAAQYPEKAPFPPPVERFIAGVSQGVHDGDGDSVTGKVTNPRLGQFGFCSKGGGDDFFYFPRHADGSGNYPNFKDYWLTDETAFKKEVLGKLSKIDNKAASGFELANRDWDTGEQWHSVRFANDRADYQTAIVFRTGIYANPFATVNVTSDIKVVQGSLSEGHFELRAPVEGNPWFKPKAASLFVEQEIAYTFTDDAIWAAPDAAEVCRGRITTRLAFDSEIDKQSGKLPTEKDVDVLSVYFDRTIKAMRLARLDLRNIASELPQSVLPEVRIDLAGVARFALSGVAPLVIAGAGVARRIEWRPRYPERKVWPGLDLRLSLAPRARKSSPRAKRGSPSSCGPHRSPTNRTERSRPISPTTRT